MKDIEQCREEIDEIDKEIINLLVRRLRISEEIADFKKAKNIEIRDEQREKLIMYKVSQMAKEYNISEHFLQIIFRNIIEYTVKHEKVNIN